MYESREERKKKLKAKKVGKLNVRKWESMKVNGERDREVKRKK